MTALEKVRRMRVLEEERSRIRDIVYEGGQVKCSVCGSRCAGSAVTMNRPKVIFLASLVRAWQERGGGWVSTRDHMKIGNNAKASNDGVDLRHWGLIERCPKESRKDGKLVQPKGIYRPTEKGLAFLRGEIRVSRGFRRFRKERWWLEETISAEEAFDTPFDYEEAVRGIQLTDGNCQGLLF